MKSLFKGGSPLASAALAAALATSVHAEAGDDFFVPDLVDAKFADESFASGLDHDALPSIPGFWTDLVDTENVSATGEGVYVAVLDTGLLPNWMDYFHENRIATDLGIGFTHDIQWDLPNDNITIGPLESDRGFITDLASGHGTHVTSTVSGYNYNDIAWIPGVAPEATIIPVLVLDAWEVDSPYGTLQFSGGTDEMIAAGIHYIADLADDLDGPVVINMSLGGPSRSALIEEAVDTAIAAGVIVVASAGNSGSDGMGYPGGLPQIISAGAAGWASMFDAWWTGDAPERLNRMDAYGNASQIYLEDFSSRPNMALNQFHQDLDVSAPGAWVVGPYKSAFADNTGYYFLSGTSMASPHVAGISALVLEQQPGTRQSEMEFILEQAAAGNPLPASDAWVSFPFIPEGGYTASWDGGDYGSGFLQADQALRAARRH